MSANDDLETSPYKSKFTVLKLTQSSTKSSKATFSSATKPLRIFQSSPEKNSDQKPSFVSNLFGEGKLEDNLRAPILSSFQLSENMNPQSYPQLFDD